MKKTVSLLIFIGILFAFNLAIAKNQPSGRPFSSLWQAVGQGGGWQEERIQDIEDRLSELEETIEGKCNAGDAKTCDSGLEGVCASGIKTCQNNRTWGDCIPNEDPSDELCDSLDNDCDGLIDEICGPVVEDDFNSYSLGSIVSQGGWQSYVNGSDFIVQDVVVKEGSRGLIIDASGDSVIVKQGANSANGRQTVWVNGDLTRWDSSAFLQVRLSKGPWGDPFVAVTFEQDGKVGYSPYSGAPYVYFATYRYEWTRLDIEWRSTDNKARYRVNTETWTDWDTFPGSSSFTGFDYIGFDFSKSSGSGEVYIDHLY